MLKYLRIRFLDAGRHLSWLFLQAKGFLIFGRPVGILGDFHVSNPANVSIGRYCGVNHGVFILGHIGVSIGNNVIISANAMILDAGLDVSTLVCGLRPSHLSSPVTIEDHVWIGAGSIILPGVRVGTSSVIAAGAVVTRDVPPMSLVAGVPARVIKSLA